MCHEIRAPKSGSWVPPGEHARPQWMRLVQMLRQIGEGYDAVTYPRRGRPAREEPLMHAGVRTHGPACKSCSLLRLGSKQIRTSRVRVQLLVGLSCSLLCLSGRPRARRTSLDSAYKSVTAALLCVLVRHTG